MTYSLIKLTLEECVEQLIDYRGKTPKKTDSGIPLITAKVIKNGKILPPTEFIAENDYESWMRRGIPKEGDVVLTVEAPLGEVAQLDSRKIALAQRVITLRGKKDLLNNTFLKYLLMSNEFQSALNGRASGTTVLGIKQSELRKIQLTFPHLSIQKKIAHILSTLDNKIELNKKINQTLESLAQTIFKSWFVDFDPVHAKANAQSEDEHDAIAKELGISREILDLFPSEFEESELGLIPKGWRPTKIENYIEILDSKRVPLSKNEREKRKGNIPYYGATSIMDYIDDFLFDEPLTLIGEDGSVVKEDGTPFTQYIWGKSWVNNHAHVLKAKKNLSTEGIYILFKDTNVSSYVTGAVQPKINQNNLKRIPILEPSNHLYGEFSKFIDPLFSMVRIRTDETLQLCKLRDYLLPKLLSGEIDVSNLNLEPDND
ncbi:TPA: restriction endonuclease subunit S [Legionella pneumophila]